MKFHLDDFTRIAKKIRSDDAYNVYDFNFLNNLTVSMTHLHPGKNTKGHSHENEDEVYIFLGESGEMQIGEERFPVKGGDVVLVSKGKFHRVFNPNGSDDLRFFCVFEKYRKREKESKG